MKSVAFSFIPAGLVLIAGLVLLGCGDTQMTLLDEELSIYRYEQEKYRRESLEDLYFEETMRCEDLTAEILELENSIEDKTRELGDLNARLARIDAQLAAAEKRLADAEKVKQPAKPTAKPPAKQPAKQPAKPPQKKPPAK